MGDIAELMAQADREIILAFSGTGDGKSRTVAHLIQDCQETGKKVLIIDRDMGLARPFREVFGMAKPDNVEYFAVHSWADVEAGIAMAFEWLARGDWLIIEGAHKLWDLAQNEYSARVYGKDHIAHVLDLRAQAEERINNLSDSGELEVEVDKETNDNPTEKQRAEAERKVLYSIRQSATGFGGFAGTQDWPYIKGLHNEDFFDRIIADGTFNVLTTTKAEMLSDKEKEASNMALYLRLGVKPGGEKDNGHRHSTIVYLYKAGDQFCWRTDLGGGYGDDRGFPLVRDEFCTDLGAVAGILAHHAQHLEGGGT